MCARSAAGDTISTSFNGIPIRVRYVWSKITPTTCHREQAFSTDDGVTWETNWEMDFVRVE
jgi:hypothetical protein